MNIQLGPVTVTNLQIIVAHVVGDGLLSMDYLIAAWVGMEGTLMLVEPMMWSTVRCAMEPKEPSRVLVSVQCLVLSTSHEGPSGP